MRTRLIRVDPEKPDAQVIREAALLLRRGGLVAFPTETVYGLGANLEDPQAIQELYRVKQRPFEKQVTLHIARFEELELEGVEVTPLAWTLMERFWPGPLTIILRRENHSTVGFRMPNHPVALQLIQGSHVPVVASSANLSGASPPRTAQEVFEALADQIDLILDAGPTPVGVESTVVDLTGDAPRVLRAGAFAASVAEFFKMARV